MFVVVFLFYLNTSISNKLEKSDIRKNYVYKNIKILAKSDTDGKASPCREQSWPRRHGLVALHFNAPHVPPTIALSMADTCPSFVEFGERNSRKQGSVFMSWLP